MQSRRAPAEATIAFRATALVIGIPLPTMVADFARVRPDGPGRAVVDPGDSAADHRFPRRANRVPPPLLRPTHGQWRDAPKIRPEAELKGLRVRGAPFL